METDVDAKIVDTTNEKDESASRGEQSPSPVKYPRTIKPLSYEDRKNSSSDLHSRLKTRKVLGVGEIRDDGDIYRSKISQILGHSEHLYIKLPRGLFYWQATNVAYLFGSGLLCLLLPEVAVSLEILVCPASETVQLPHQLIRLYGSAMIGFCILQRGLMATRERAHIANGLLGSSVLFGLQVIVTLPTVYSCRHSISNLQLFVLITKAALGVIGNFVYYGITCNQPSSFSSLLSRFLRRFFGTGGSPGDNMAHARTPVTASNYNIAGNGNNQIQDPTDVQESNVTGYTHSVGDTEDKKGL